MASLNKAPNGRWVCQVGITGPDGRKVRRSIRLGQANKATARGIHTRINHLESAKASGQPIDSATAEWLADIGDTLHARLARAGLIEPREARQRATLGPFTSHYIEGRMDAKPRTITNLKQAQARMIEFFGADRPLDSISPGDADEWYQWLVGVKQYAPATIGRTVKRARQFCIAAIRRGVAERNPFSDTRAPEQSNRQRDCFVSRETTQRVIEACPDVQWRCIVALSRYGGIRTPSELLALTWRDIDWERSRFRVHSSKTEHHDGKGSRWVPLFPELRPYLERAFDQADPGDVHVITRYREININLRTQLLRIIERAGVDEWPKPFQNMRASRETELCQTFPLHVACSWLGNSTTIAAKHYLQVTEEHFAQATEGGAQSGARAVQNAVRPLSADNGHNRPDAAQTQAEQAFRQTSANTGELWQPPTSTPCRTRTTPENKGKTGPDAKSGAQSGALSGGSIAADADLRRLIAAWPTLPAATRAGIIAAVDAAAGGPDTPPY